MGHVSNAPKILDRISLVDYGKQLDLKPSFDVRQSVDITEKYILQKFDEMVRECYEQRNKKEFSFTLGWEEKNLANLFANKIQRDGISDVRIEEKLLLCRTEHAWVKNIVFSNKYYEENLEQQVKNLVDTMQIALHAGEPFEVSLLGKDSDFREKLQKVLIEAGVSNMLSIDIIGDRMRISFSNSNHSNQLISKCAEEVFQRGENWMKTMIHLEDEILIPVVFVPKGEVAVGTGLVTVSGSMTKETLAAVKKHFEGKYDSVSINVRGENQCTIQFKNPYL